MGTIRIETEGAIGWLIIDAPQKHNAMTAQMWEDLPLKLAALTEDPSLRVIVLRGAGERAFSAGADISEFQEMRQGDAATIYNELNTSAFAALRGASKPLIAMIDGYCLGGGALLAFAADLRIASEEALFSLPPAKLGLGFDVEWIKLVLSVMPAAFAREMLYTGARFKAARLQDAGALNRVVARADLLDETRLLAAEIAGNAPLSVHAFKRAIDDVARPAGPLDAETHNALTKACFDSEDYKEGQLAFQEKRKPVFKGS